MAANPVICLMGPTATGKTDIAVRLGEQIPADIISVDSALVYRGMDIGTAKPDAEMLARAPHKLIDIRDPEENYSAGNFVADARREIDVAHASGRIPLLVGGTMMYFRSLTRGLAELPQADSEIRNNLDAEAAEHGWPSLHEKLQAIDPQAAKRINRNDSQRIQRALEVFAISGKTLTAWHARATDSTADYRFIKIGLMPTDRNALHARIEARLNVMMDNGFVEEVRDLMKRPAVTADCASMRAVGYRQLLPFLAGQIDLASARYKALVATRQLAKRQMTWLRAERNLISFDPLEVDAFGAISAFVTKQMDV